MYSRVLLPTLALSVALLGCSDGESNENQEKEKEDLSAYDAELDNAEVECEPQHSSYDGAWFPEDDNDLSYSPITGRVEWVEGDGTVTLIQEQQGTSATYDEENLVKFELTWETPTDPGDSVRTTGRMTGGKYGGYAVICVSGVARVGNVIEGIEYTTLVFDRFGETNADGSCEGADLPIEDLAYGCLSPPRF
jgi:hypothetical protein